MSETKPTYSFGVLPTDELPPADELGDLHAQLGLDPDAADYRIKMYRYTGGRGGAWLFDLGVGDDSQVLERLRDEYSGGQFEIRVYKDTKIDKRLKLSVEAPKHRPKTEAAAQGDMLALLREQQQQFMAQIKELVNRVQPPAAPAVDQALMEERMLARMVTYKELFAQPAAPRGPDTLAQFRDFLEVSRELGIGQGEGGDSNMLGQLAPMLIDMIKTSAAPAQARPPSRPALPKPPNERPVASAYQPSETSQTANTPQTSEIAGEPMSFIESNLSRLCAAAMLRLSPAVAAKSVYDDTPDAYLDLMAELVEADDCVQRLVELYAPVANYRAWFESLRAKLLEMFAAEAAAADAEDVAEGQDSTVHPDEDLHGDDARPISRGRGSHKQKADNAADHAAAAPGHAGKTPTR